MKSSLRDKHRRSRLALTKEYISSKSRTIKEKLFSLDEFRQAKTVMFYHSFDNEVSTADMIKEALNNKVVALPYLVENQISVSIIHNADDLERSSLGIKEPKEKRDLNADDIDIIIVPGIAFDRRGNRLGYGRGCYDKFLKKAGKAIKIALAYGPQVIEEVPAGIHDVRMDIIITDKEIIRCRI